MADNRPPHAGDVSLFNNEGRPFALVVGLSCATARFPFVFEEGALIAMMLYLPLLGVCISCKHVTTVCTRPGARGAEPHARGAGHVVASQGH